MLGGDRQVVFVEHQFPARVTAEETNCRETFPGFPTRSIACCSFNLSLSASR